MLSCILSMVCLGNLTPYWFPPQSDLIQSFAPLSVNFFQDLRLDCSSAYIQHHICHFTLHSLSNVCIFYVIWIGRTITFCTLGCLDRSTRRLVYFVLFLVIELGQFNVRRWLGFSFVSLALVFPSLEMTLSYLSMSIPFVILFH